MHLFSAREVEGALEYKSKQRKTAHPPLKVLSREFIKDLLPIWAFLNRFSDIIDLTRFSIEEFGFCFFCDDENPLLRSIYWSIVCIFGVDGSLWSSDWEEALHNFLFQKDKALASNLAEMSYFKLSFSVRVQILKTCYYEVLMTHNVRFAMKKCTTLRNNILNRYFKPGDVDDNHFEMILEGTEELGSLLHHNEPIGTDRCGNRYYWFGTHEYVRVGVPPEYCITPLSFLCIFVQLVSEDAWCYCPPSNVDFLLL